MNIQNVLKKLNEKMTDAEIGVAIGVSQPTVTRLRRGVHKSTTYETAKRIEAVAKSRGIDVNAEYLGV